VGGLCLTLLSAMTNQRYAIQADLASVKALKFAGFANNVRHNLLSEAEAARLTDSSPVRTEGRLKGRDRSDFQGRQSKYFVETWGEGSSKRKTWRYRNLPGLKRADDGYQHAMGGLDSRN